MSNARGCPPREVAQGEVEVSHHGHHVKLTGKPSGGLPWVPEGFFSLGATELSGEARKASGEAARKKPLAPTDN